MSETFPVTVAPLKNVGMYDRDIREFGRIGWEVQFRYVQTPHLYVVDSTDIIMEPWAIPSYIGEPKNRWLTGYVYLDILAKKYPEDEFLKRCQDPKRIFEEGETHRVETEYHKGLFSKEKKEYLSPQTIADLHHMGDREAVKVRIVAPEKIKIKYRRKGLFDRHPTPYITR